MLRYALIKAARYPTGWGSSYPIARSVLPPRVRMQVTRPWLEGSTTFPGHGPKRHDALPIVRLSHKRLWGWSR